MRNSQKRQRVLYLHATAPNLGSRVIAADLHEPAGGALPLQLSPHPRMPYDTVSEAVHAGWRVVSFPGQGTTGDDRELGNFAYEFILEKFEECDD